MRELVIALTKLATEITGNPYLRFIIKKNSEAQKIKAYKKLTLVLYLHVPGKNIKCIEYSQNANTSNIDEERIWKEVEPYFFYEVIKWVMGGKLEELLNGLQME